MDTKINTFKLNAYINSYIIGYYYILIYEENYGIPIILGYGYFEMFKVRLMYLYLQLCLMHTGKILTQLSTYLPRRILNV